MDILFQKMDILENACSSLTIFGVLCPLGCARLDIVREIRTFTVGSPILMVRLHLMEVFDALADGQGEIKDIPQR